VGPAAPALTKPGDREAVGELVQIDGVAAGAAVDRESATGKIQIGQAQLGEFGLAEGVDGDQPDDQPCHGAVGLVEQATEPV
jgi:hypothetical protein